MNYKKMWVEENHCLFDLVPALLNYGPRPLKKFGHSVKNAVIFGDGFHAQFYMPEEELNRVAEEGYNFFMNKEKVNLLLSEIKKINKKVIEGAKEIAKADFAKLTNQELNAMSRYYGAEVMAQAFTNYVATQPHHMPKIEKELRDYLQKIGIKDIPETIQKLTTPKKRIIFIENGFFSKSFAELLESEDAKLDAQIVFKENIKEEDIDQSEKKELMIKLNLPEKIRYIANLIATLGEERYRMRTVWMIGQYYSELFLHEIKKRFNISKEELRLYFIPEIEILTETGKKVDPALLNERKKGVVAILNNEAITILIGKEALEFLETIEKKVNKEIKEVRGTPASKGRVRGKVIVFSNIEKEDHLEKINKMEFGQIIVSQMTQPNIIMACEKAGAIITDEGGLLCHAAIVCREMGIPCIVGTEIATEVFHDGDLVEVDADNGIIRRIE